jgi:type I restriction enzyme, S subunit
MTKLQDGWEIKRLDEIADVVMGQSPPGSSYNDHGDGQPFFQGKTEFGEVHPTVRKYTTAGTKFAKAGDILMSVRAPVGPTNIADIGCVIGRGLAAIRAKSVVSQSYLRWTLKHLELDIQSKGTGTTFDAITGETLRGTLIALPPMAEQLEIVELLEGHLSHLHAALADVQQAKLKAAQFRRSLLQASFSGYLSDESFTIGSEIPPSWIKISLGNVLVPRKQKDIPSTFPDLPYIGMEHVARDVGLINLFGSSADYRSAAPRVYEGDVLYGRLRPYLNKVAISPCEAFASGEFIVLPPNEKIIGKFLQLRLLSQDFVEFAGTLDTGDRPRVSWEQISRFEVALPPIDEQMKIISSLEKHLSRLDASVSLADAMEKQSNGLRRSLLQAAFTGQLTNEVVSV